MEEKLNEVIEDLQLLVAEDETLADKIFPIIKKLIEAKKQPQ
jgi:hypothetical protein